VGLGGLFLFFLNVKYILAANVMTPNMGVNMYIIILQEKYPVEYVNPKNWYFKKL
jgi:hypothetical protein